MKKDLIVTFFFIVQAMPPAPYEMSSRPRHQRSRRQIMSIAITESGSSKLASMS